MIYKKEIILIGAGGHAKVCIDNLHSAGQTVAFCVARDGAPDTCMGIPVLKGDHHLTELYSKGYRHIFVAIGNNALRWKLAAAAIDAGYRLVNAINPHAVISTSVRMGTGVAIMAGAIINADTSIGDLCIVNTGAIIDHDCCIDSGAHIAPQCVLAGNVVVGERTFLGVGCKVIPEIHIGSDCTIGAGSLLICNVRSGSKWYGVPAKEAGARGQI